MELPQFRPFAEGRKPTHDFLSLYSHSSVQQDPRPSSQAGGYLKTHDFLQVERLGKASAKEEPPVEVASAENPPPVAAPPPSVEHILPGGIGTYSISHISYFNSKVPKTEGSVFSKVAPQRSSSERNDENSNCSSYSGSGFTLWEESAAKKGKTRKENNNTVETLTVLKEATDKVGQWGTSSLEKASQSSTNNCRNSFSSLSSSHHRRSSKQKCQSFMEMIKSANGSVQHEHDDFEENEDFVLKKESSTTSHCKEELRVKLDGNIAPDHKANTPRSRHSATEQRRRSKINDRFLMLRDIIPHSDQKRDKASFLLEVIKYIQFLQEKVHKYEGTYQGWSQEPSKLMPRRNIHKPTENYADQSRAINGASTPAYVFSSKFDEKNITVAPTIPGTAQNPIDSDPSKATTLRSMNLHPVMTNDTMPFPVSLHPNFFTSSQSSGVAAAQRAPIMPSETQNGASRPQSIPCLAGSFTTNGVLPSEKLKEQELSIEGGKISISSVYSQGLLNTLTQALTTSGVDLSHASISVQIEVGKRSCSKPTALTSTLKDREALSTNKATTRTRLGNDEDSDQPLKELKT